MAKSRYSNNRLQGNADTTRINDRITSKMVRMIDHEKQNRGVLPLEEALQIASEAGMDLVEVSPNSDPPVCRVMDYSKYRYEKQKREKIAKQGSKSKQMKEMRVTPKIGAHDLEIKVEHAKEFLEDGHRVQFTMRFKGREARHTEVGRAIMDRIIVMMEDVAKVEFGPRQEGRRMVMLLVPKDAESRLKAEKAQRGKA